MATHVVMIVVFFNLLRIGEASENYFSKMYCGNENCYDVLGIERTAFDKAELGKLYRRLAAKHHPDRQKGTAEDKQDAEVRFRAIATAYEVLKDDETHRDYDYYLDHPDEFYYNTYAYYRRRVAPKVDVRYVIAGTILVISIVQYISAVHKYNEAVAYLMREPKYRNQAERIAKEQRKFYVKETAKRDGFDKMDKADIKEHNEKVLRAIIMENVDIKGGYRKPNLLDVLACQIVLLPYTLFKYAKWYLRWLIKFTFNKEEYGLDEKLYLIRRNFGMSQAQFDSLDEDKHDEYLTHRLWITDVFREWKREQEEEAKIKMAQSGKYKMYRRYMKNHGTGQISFADD